MRLGVSAQEVIDMNRRLGGDVSLNAPIGDGTDLGEWQDRLVADRAGPESQLAESQEGDNRRKALREGLAVLDARERRIFERRQLTEDPAKLETLAEEFSISRERVRQIEARAFEKVQKAVKRRLAAIER
jgi:RNA polymerase sigma-32 factor